MSIFLENKNSAYYKEIREQWNTYSLLNDKPFLNAVLRDYLEQSIHNNLLKLYSDYVINLLKDQYDKTSIYNQPYYNKWISKDEGYDLPLYYHILFIGFLYSSAIENNVDINSISNKHRNMQSIYSSIVGSIISNTLA